MIALRTGHSIKEATSETSEGLISNEINYRTTNDPNVRGRAREVTFSPRAITHAWRFP
jgi:hypothetical protein